MLSDSAVVRALRHLPLLLPAAALCACAPHIALTRPASSCATLIPDDWRTRVAGAPIPAGDTTGEWIAFGDAQTGALERQYDRTLGSIQIVEKCEARDAEAEKAATRKPWYRRLLG